MTLKVVQGLVGSAPYQSSINNRTSQNSNSAATAQQATGHQVAIPVVSSDAVVTTVRTVTRAAASAEKKLSVDEAKDIASDLAKRIRDSEGEGEFNPHAGLESVEGSTSAQEHLK